jgi:hypothetical protein
MERKSSKVKIRTTGDLPSIPGEVTKDYPSLNNWWDDSVAVIDRLRDSSTSSTSTTTAPSGETYTTAEKEKLSRIEGSATADLTAAEVKALYETSSDTNAFTDEEKLKLSQLTISAAPSAAVIIDTGTTNTDNRPIAKASSDDGSSGATRFVFTTATNQSQWEINHDLGFYPNVQVYGPDYEEIYADVQHTNQFQTLVNFIGTTTGYAVLT